MIYSPGADGYLDIVYDVGTTAPRFQYSAIQPAFNNPFATQWNWFSRRKTDQQPAEWPDRRADHALCLTPTSRRAGYADNLHNHLIGAH